jgi:putative acetyltransferase
MDVIEDDLSGEDIAALLQDHLQSMRVESPPGSSHALDIDGLREPDVVFWSAWEGAQLLGCGALKHLDTDHAEIKAMKTVPGHLRKGVAALLLQHILQQAHARGYRRLSLETGAQAFFEPARRLYQRSGFEYCAPFSDYWDDPNSVFMTLEI